MSDTRSELKKLVPLYCDELNSLDLSSYSYYEFSKDYLNKKRKAHKEPKPHLLSAYQNHRTKDRFCHNCGSYYGYNDCCRLCTARNAVRNFFLQIFNDHTVVSVQHDSKDIGDHKSKIEKQYSITVPEGFVLDESESVSTDNYIELCYYSDDKKKSIYFDQYTADSYSSYYDNERGHFKTSSDKFGNEFMIYINDDFISILWDNGKYIFEICSNLDKRSVLELCESTKIK